MSFPVEIKFRDSSGTERSGLWVDSVFSSTRGDYLVVRAGDEIHRVDPKTLTALRPPTRLEVGA